MVDNVPVSVAYLRGQLSACHSAIRSIWHIFDDVNARVREPAELVEAIRGATKLLPSEVLTDEALVGTTYWYHPESDSYFKLDDGAAHPATKGMDGALCEQITKGEYEKHSSPTIDLEDFF